MCQDAGGNAHDMPNQITPMRVFDVEDRGQGAEDQIYQPGGFGTWDFWKRTLQRLLGDY